MSLIGTITSNPDFALLVSGAIGWAGKQFWNKAKEKTNGEIWDTALKIAWQAFPKLFDDPKLYDDEHVREVITKTIWRGLDRISVPRNPTIEKLVAEVVEHAVGELAMAIWKHQFGAMQKPLQSAAVKLKSLPPEVAIEPEPATP